MAVVAFVVHPERPEAARLADSAGRWLRERGHEVRVPAGEALTEAPPSGLGEGLDLAVSLGGDGTMLRTVQLAAPAGVPVLGVNLGQLGYLTEVESARLEPALERFLSGQHGVEERMTLEVAVESAAGTVPHACLALNEAAVEKTGPGHSIRLAASIEGRPFISYLADGLLVSTPTGSTAYNLSARGPIVSPLLRAMIVVPISAHMLFDRAVVLDPAEWLRLELLGQRPAALVLDGSEIATLAPGDAVVCRVSDHPARLVTFAPRDFYGILKAKFGLADR